MSKDRFNLEKEIGILFLNEKSKIDDFIALFKKYEKINLDKITKLNRTKKVEHNRVKGALKQTINAHGPIDNRLIGSATKRILGSLLLNEEPKTYFHFNSFAWGVIFTLLIVSLIL